VQAVPLSNILPYPGRLLQEPDEINPIGFTVSLLPLYPNRILPIIALWEGNGPRAPRRSDRLRVSLGGPVPIFQTQAYAQQRSTDAQAGQDKREAARPPGRDAARQTYNPGRLAARRRMPQGEESRDHRFSAPLRTGGCGGSVITGRSACRAGCQRPGAQDGSDLSARLYHTGDLRSPGRKDRRGPVRADEHPQV